ncbi:hypothetical protein P8452_56269 [Trifolium repens]|nr:hypothetical protein P8452_56269 [Trifolium repens]
MIQECVPCLVSPEENHSLTSVPTEAEIKTAIFDMNGDGAPGPDGFVGHFYQHFWDIVAFDVTYAVQSFL